MIVLELPDHTQVRLGDAAARSLVDTLWDLARRQGGTAVLAIAIEEELCRQPSVRRVVDVPERAAARLSEALQPR